MYLSGCAVAQRTRNYRIRAQGTDESNRRVIVGPNTVRHPKLSSRLAKCSGGHVLSMANYTFDIDPSTNDCCSKLLTWEDANVKRCCKTSRTTYSGSFLIRHGHVLLMLVTSAFASSVQWFDSRVSARTCAADGNCCINKVTRNGWEFIIKVSSINKCLGCLSCVAVCRIWSLPVGHTKPV